MQEAHVPPGIKIIVHMLEELVQVGDLAPATLANSGNTVFGAGGLCWFATKIENIERVSVPIKRYGPSSGLF